MSYKFKVGDKGKTGQGNDYEVVAVDVQGLAKGRAIVAVVDGYPAGYLSNGQEQQHKSIYYDLLPPEQYGYINVFSYVTGRPMSVLYTDAADAEQQANENMKLNSEVTYHHIALPVLLKQGNG